MRWALMSKADKHTDQRRGVVVRVTYVSLIASLRELV